MYMKKHPLFPGFILLGFGLYFFLQRSNIQLIEGFYSWPTLLFIIGIAFTLQAYIGKEYESILPGVIFLGLGIHFHVVHKVNIWPDHIGAFLLIISLGFFLKHQKTNQGFFFGLLFLILALMQLFYDEIANWFGLLENSMSMLLNIWPIILMLIGGYFLFVKRK